MSDVLKGVWIGFWQAAAFFFACMAEGFSIISRFCGSLAGRIGMSDVMLKGILNMPLPEQPEDCDVVTWVQFKAAASQSADRIEELEANLANVKEFLQFLDENYRHAFGDIARQKIRELYEELKVERG